MNQNHCETCINFKLTIPPALGECNLRKQSKLYNDTCKDYSDKLNTDNDVINYFGDIFGFKK